MIGQRLLHCEITEKLEETGGNVTRTAKLPGLERGNLYRKDENPWPRAKGIVMTFALLFLLCGAANAQLPDTPLDSLQPGQTIHGFETRAVYLNNADRPFGGRFVHRTTGFTLDLLRIESVPQGFIWVTAPPTSNMGEPHTVEHLLLGKGNMGRTVANLAGMSLTGMSAFTEQWHTCYGFHTTAGPEVFLQQFERRLDALLHPDYTDEEIRREVRNFGLTVNGGSLKLEETGTVYSEMVSSMDQPGWRLHHAFRAAAYGPEHPMAFSAGGLPEGLRVLRPEHIRAFHAANYHLANMGVIGAFPKTMAVGATLARFDAALVRLQGQAPRRPVRTAVDLPAPRPAPAAQIQIVEYPHKNEQQPGLVFFGWPASRTLDPLDFQLLNLFLNNIAGDATTNLYKRFVDSRTREVDIGARGVGSRVIENPGYPVLISLVDVAAAHIREDELAQLRRRVREELARIAAWPDGSADLAEFNTRARGRIVQHRRDLAKFLNSPPKFGLRGAQADWMYHLDRLAGTAAIRKSVTLKPELAKLDRLLAGDRNLWRDALQRWKLLDTEPYVLGTRANPALITQATEERQARVRAETARLVERYGAANEQEALRHYQADYDKDTAEIDAAAARLVPPRFIDNPPLGLDEHLDYRVTRLPGEIPLLAATFESMTGAHAGLALRLDGVAERQLVYLSALPELLTRVGVIENGTPVSYERMVERLRREIYSLSSNFDLNSRTSRVELMLHGAGNDAAESRQALAWMKLVLYHPDWRPENLPRIGDALDRLLGDLRNTTQAPEERWAQAPANAWRRQDNPLMLAAGCFLTRAHNVHRLRWRLKNATPKARAAVSAFLAEAAGLRGSREELKKAVAAKAAWVAEGARTLAGQAARDLEQVLTDIPDSSLAADWAHVCNEMHRDLEKTPARTLAELDSVRKQILRAGGARMFVVGSTATQKELGAGIRELTAGLDAGLAAKVAYAATRRIEARLRAREPQAAAPVFVGLLNPNTQGGVFVLSAPAAGYTDTDHEALLDYLAADQYSGSGGHSLFTKINDAGLSYGGGIWQSPAAARLEYYAGRAPELPQTLRFAINVVKKARPDAAIAEYAVAQAFREEWWRAASSYEWRAEAMANDLADGITPAVVARFRKAILDLRRSPGLAEELHRRLTRVCARVLPGLGAPVKGVEGGVYFVVGPEKQFAAWEQYLRGVEGPETKVWRLYPRDFWSAVE